jgi:hypothetical protein
VAALSEVDLGRPLEEARSGKAESDERRCHDSSQPAGCRAGYGVRPPFVASPKSVCPSFEASNQGSISPARMA